MVHVVKIERDGEHINVTYHIGLWRYWLIGGRMAWLTLEEATEIRDQLSGCLMDVDAQQENIESRTKPR